MRYENANEVTASANKEHENLTIGSSVKITKGKRARTWKILGLLKPLPLLDGGGGMQFLVASRTKVKYIFPNQILEALEE